MATQKQQGIKKQLTKGFVKVAIIGAIAAVIGIVALLIAAMPVSYTHLTLPTTREV